jgi:hypothetical protein
VTDAQLTAALAVARDLSDSYALAARDLAAEIDSRMVAWDAERYGSTPCGRTCGPQGCWSEHCSVS